METLVQSVLSDFYPGCEVYRCGSVADGGIDLLLVLSDEPIAVQVKRRTNSDSVEPVSSIRDFLGACQLQEYDSALYVTTADHYSTGQRGAQAAAAKAVELGKMKRFDLIDRDKFFGMLNAVNGANGEAPAWSEHMPWSFQHRFEEAAAINELWA